MATPAASRRSLLSGFVPLGVALAVGGSSSADAAPSPSPDANLIALGRRITANRSEYLARTEPYYDGAPEPAENHERVVELVAEGHRLTEELADMRAVTLDGLRAKARALRNYQVADEDGNPDWGNHDELMGWSIARDLLGEV